jgi:hypothetical protein
VGRGRDGDLTAAGVVEVNDSLLRLACRQKMESVALLLVGEGVDLDRRNKRGETALTLACAQGLSTVAMLLIGRGADVGGRDSAVAGRCVGAGGGVRAAVGHWGCRLRERKRTRGVDGGRDTIACFARARTPFLAPTTRAPRPGAPLSRTTSPGEAETDPRPPARRGLPPPSFARARLVALNGFARECRLLPFLSPDFYLERDLLMATKQQGSDRERVAGEILRLVPTLQAEYCLSESGVFGVVGNAITSLLQ